MSATERTKDRSNLLQHWEGRVLGLSSATSRKVLSDRPALKPDWGKPTVRNFREEDGNGSYRAILLPERQSSTLRLTVLVSLMGSSFLSEVRNTSILRTGALHRYHYLLTWLPASRLLPPRRGLERSDFVLWPKAAIERRLLFRRC
jgi:hypothetical protein